METSFQRRRVLLSSISAAALLSCCAPPNAQVLQGIPSLSIRVAAQIKAPSSALLYVVTSEGFVEVLSYPECKKLGALRVARRTTEPITSSSETGDLLINSGGTIYEYKHAGENPIAEIHPPSSYALAPDYAFDPTSRAIAVSLQNPTGKGAVAVYKTPSGSPITFSVPNMQYPQFVGYDDLGNLFVDGLETANGPYVFAELPKRGTSFHDVTLGRGLNKAGIIQWDGSHITIASGRTIDEIAISGSSGTIVGQARLDGAWARQPLYWIDDGTVIAPHLSATHTHNGRKLAFWHYPQGGHAFRVLGNLSADKSDWVSSEAVSGGPR